MHVPGYCAHRRFSGFNLEATLSVWEGSQGEVSRIQKARGKSMKRKEDSNIKSSRFYFPLSSFLCFHLLLVGTTHTRAVTLPVVGVSVPIAKRNKFAVYLSFNSSKNRPSLLL